MEGIVNTVQELMDVLASLPPDAKITIRVPDVGCGCCSGDDNYEPIGIVDYREDRGHFTLV